jgi:aldose 1-epimerase
MSLANKSSSITKTAFGTTPDGRAVELYTLRNSHGVEATIMTYGGVVQKLVVPDKQGRLADVVAGFDTLDDYTSGNYVARGPYFGAIIGRYGNRIGGGAFRLNGHSYSLAKNNGGNTLHGGLKGFDKVVWSARPSEGAQGPQLVLTYRSPDGEEGFPGNLDITAIYTLTEDNALKLECTAITDRPTVVNLTQHSYFNLAGQGNGDVLNHVAYINADQTTPVDAGLIPTGALADVTGTPFDFRTPTVIGARIDQPDPFLKYGGGYDHNWVINKPPGELGLHARVTEPASGRVLEVWSDQPGLQFYTGNHLDGSFSGKGGKNYSRRSAFAMEPQHYPDSPNQPAFPSVLLRPGETYRCVIAYKFSVA